MHREPKVTQLVPALPVFSSTGVRGTVQSFQDFLFFS
jgi:hypothetical protein